MALTFGAHRIVVARIVPASGTAYLEAACIARIRVPRAGIRTS
jgi:hypothetical protein